MPLTLQISDGPLFLPKHLQQHPSPISRELSTESIDYAKEGKEIFFKVENVTFEDLYNWESSHNPLPSSPSTGKLKTGTAVFLNGKKIALFRYGERVFAIDEKCPHMGGPLHLGDIETVGEANILCVVCPWHKWKVDITNGRLKVPAGRGKRNETYPVRVNLEDGSIAIGFAAFNDELLSGMEVDF